MTSVADALGISDRYLYNLFIRHEGISPKQYINDLRIRSAKALLRDTEYSVTEIGESVGFGDVLTFSRFFSKFAGISPTAYRRTVAEE